MMNANEASPETWPSLPLTAWIETCTTLHLWTQVVGKIRLSSSPWINHSWHTTLYVTPRGLTTGPIYQDARAFQINFDFIAQEIEIQCDDGSIAGFPLQPQSVAVFYRRLKTEMTRLALEMKIYPKPNEIPNAIPFEKDETHASYDAEFATRFWRILLQTDRVLKIFRARFVGKCSPVHFFWGACDLAVTRFSGRLAPRHAGGVPNLPDRVTREAYSHEVSSCGFWPGGGPVSYPAFYSYAYPEPVGFARASIQPGTAFYSGELKEFILPYDAVRNSSTSDETLLAFLQSTYEAAANLGKWDRASLEGVRHLE